MTNQPFNQFSISPKAGYTHFYHSVKGGSFALSLVEIAKQSAGLLVVLLNDPSSVLSLRRELQFFLGESSTDESVDLTSEIPIVTLPDWETLPYDYFSPHQDIISERLETLYQLPRLHKGILLLPISSALQKLPPREYIELQSLILEKNQCINLNKLRKLFDNNGYSCVNKVMQHGEYAVRGSIIDLFPMGVNDPIRIELFDDEIESLRFFDAESQLTKQLTNQIKLLPAREFPTNEDAISRFRESWRSRFDSDVMSSPIYRDVSNGIFPAGIDYYLPLFFDQLSTIFDYLPETNCQLLSKEKPETTMQAFWLELNERYEQYRHDLERPIVNPKDLYLQQDEFNQRCRQYSNIMLSDESLGKKTQSVDLNFKPCPDVFVDHKLTQPLSKLDEQCTKFKRVLLCAESTGRQEVIRELLTKYQISVQLIQNWQEFIDSNQPTCLLHCQLTQGFSHDELLVICESDLFGRHVLMDRRRGDKVISPDQLIHSLAEL
ncbi:MAG: transcription-repair coupling factor, partial [Kangiellaceae bacterium]|nr:transcription-repair coupling factor [Kangiellaceae bacterium]